MSAGLVNTLEHRAARNLASIALADRRIGLASIRLYAQQGGELRAIRHLAKPCATIRTADSRIILVGGSEADVVANTGGVTWGEWCDAEGVAISAGRVTDQAGSHTDLAGDVVADPEGLGSFVLAGTTGTKVYAGGLVNLYAAAVG